MSITTPISLPSLKDIKPAEPAVTVTERPITPPTLFEMTETLKSQLSSGASIHFKGSEQYLIDTKRWSTFQGPQSSAVVNITCEADIAATIKWARANSIPFLAQAGGHGFTTTLSKFPSNSIIINLRPFNKVTVSRDQGTAIISAGALTSEVIEAAHAAKSHIMTGVCNSVGAISPMLGGGLGNLMALYGMAIDNMISARLVTASGDIVNVSADENADLWWALRGAGHNFGIVSELKVKAHPQVNGGMHWGGIIAFPGTEEHLEKVIAALREMKHGEQGKPMGCTMVWAKAPPEFHPTIMVTLWHAGPADIAKADYAPLLSLKPVMDMTGPTPYTSINAPSDFACIKNDKKRPSFAAALSSLPLSSTFRTLFLEWLDFVNSDDDLGHSVVLTECYGWKVTSEVDPMSTAYPWRDSKVFMMAPVEFSKDELRQRVESYGRQFRDVLGGERVYANFANGDEDSKLLYGTGHRLERLRALKRQWDPQGAFGFYNPIK